MDKQNSKLILNFGDHNLYYVLSYFAITDSNLSCPLFDCFDMYL